MVSARKLYTPEAYLALERDAEYKSEYVDGFIVAMSGNSREHTLIEGNVIKTLNNALDDQACEVYTSTMRVQVNAARQYRYPDITVVCDEPRFADAEVDTLLNPTVIVEILSPSTESVDRGAKLLAYRLLPSLQDYLLIAQDAARVEHYTRRDDVWTFTVYEGLDAVVPLLSLGCTLALRDVYRKVKLKP